MKKYDWLRFIGPRISILGMIVPYLLVHISTTVSPTVEYSMRVWKRRNNESARLVGRARFYCQIDVDMSRSYNFFDSSVYLTRHEGQTSHHYFCKCRERLSLREPCIQPTRTESANLSTTSQCQNPTTSHFCWHHRDY